MQKRDDASQPDASQFAGMTPVNSSDLPAPLRNTLQQSQYSGWENAKVYRNGSNQYSLQLGTGKGLKTYTFDEFGQPVLSGQMNNGNPFSGMTQVAGNTLPGSLRTTLAQPQYNGWQNATLYRSNDGSQYRFQLGQGTSAKIYSFDQFGQPVQTPWNSTQAVNNPFNGLTQINSAEIPESLRNSLQASTYKGWENTALYRNSNGTQYSFQLGQGANQRTYNLDQFGQPVSPTPYLISTGVNPFVGMTQISTTEIPAALRSTLQQNQYAGWEATELYRNSTGTQYSFQLGPEGNSQLYSFDQYGHVLPSAMPSPDVPASAVGQLTGMTQVKSSQVPDLLRNSLDLPEYRGWENVPIYRNADGTQYAFQLGQGVNAKSYRFDQLGNPITSGMPGSPNPKNLAASQTMDGMTHVPADQIPSALRKTLRHSKFKGWQDTNLYRNSAGTQYQLQVGQGADTKFYKFDSNGKEIMD